MATPREKREKNSRESVTPTPREQELEKRVESLSRDLELSEARESKLWLQLRAAVETKVLTLGRDPSDLWTAATLVKSGGCTAASFSQLASRWALGLPIDIDSLREVGIVEREGSSPWGIKHDLPSGERERRVSRARDRGRQELAQFVVPLMESLWDESLRIEKETEAPGDPEELLGRVCDRMRRFSIALGAVQDVLLAEIPQGVDDTQ